jgi:hypothetical protein
MRITVITQDRLVSIDGQAFDGINLSALDSNIHAIQWYDTDGEVEIVDNRGRHIENRIITSFDEYSFLIPLWEEAKAKKEAEDLASQQKLQEELANRQ